MTTHKLKKELLVSLLIHAPIAGAAEPPALNIANTDNQDDLERFL